MNKKQLFSLLLSISMVFSLLPVNTLAQEEETNVEESLCTQSEDCVSLEHEEGCPALMLDIENDSFGEEMSSTEDDNSGEEMASTEDISSGEEITSTENANPSEEMASTENANSGEEMPFTENDNPDEGIPSTENSSDKLDDLDNSDNLDDSNDLNNLEEDISEQEELEDDTLKISDSDSTTVEQSQTPTSTLSNSEEITEENQDVVESTLQETPTLDEKKNEDESEEIALSPNILLQNSQPPLSSDSIASTSTSLPMTVAAENSEEALNNQRAFQIDGGTEGTDYSYETGVLTILTSQALTIQNISPDTPTTDRIVVDKDVVANITLAGVNIDVSGTAGTAAFQITNNGTADVTITLADDTTNTLKSGKDCAGLQKNGSGEIGKLTIQGDKDGNGTGVLNATGGSSGAGIGGGKSGSGSNITISGGMVTATGGTYGAGIGGGDTGSSSDITISGGTIYASGGTGGAGIGGGDAGSGSNITINGGTVTATSRNFGAGIGGGYYGNGSDITISGGTVTATGGNYSAGIGGGNKRNGNNITISGGTVYATGGDGSNAGSAVGGAGIGGGYIGSGSSITIKGNAFVVAFAGYKAPFAIGDGTNDIDPSAPNDEKDIFKTSGVIIEDNKGSVYGQSVSLTTDAAVPSGATLEIAEDKFLTVEGVTLTNNGTIYVDGTLLYSNDGTLSGNTLYYPLTVENGKVGENTSSVQSYNQKTYAQAGAQISVQADIIVGKITEWKTSDENVSVKDNTFTMPQNTLTVTAEYHEAPTYTVTIPTNVKLSQTQKATISASDVNIVSGKSLNVSITSPFTVSTGTDNNKAELEYTVKNNTNPITSDDNTVLTVSGGTKDATGSVELNFEITSPVVYSGTYEGTMTFTVNIK